MYPHRQRRCLDGELVEVRCYVHSRGPRRYHVALAPWWLYVVIGVWAVKMAEQYLGPQAVGVLYAVAASGLITHFTMSLVERWNARADLEDFCARHPD